MGKPTVADVLRLHGQDYLSRHSLSTPQAKAWRAICACRTAAMGGQQLACSACGHSHWQYHSCRNRHCPTCGARAKDAWLQARLNQVLDVPYTHLVFALPHEFNALYHQNPKPLINALFASVSQTLAELAANPRWMGVAGGKPAFSLVLHTWSQDLGLHIHLHAIMACGVLGQDSEEHGQWHTPVRKPDYLFPTRALSKVWRAKFMQRLRQAAPQAVPSLGKAAQALWKKDWVVYAKTPLGGAAQVLQYLSRYTHRTAIGNERILSLQGDEVVISARAKRSEGQENFMARVARVNIQQCPVCQQGRLGVVQTLARAKHLPDPFEGSARKANSRAARLRRSRAGKHVAVAAQQTGTVTRKRPLQAPSLAIMTS
ncbi:MAG: transposase, partial [Hydrogenophaga sp.]|nr:transposase [Hydrogenophaga sp.]